MNYFIKKKKSFQLIAYTSENRKKTYHPLPESVRLELKSINDRYLSGVVSEADTRLLLKDLIGKLKPRGQINAKLIQVNQQIFDQFWKDNYSSKILEDEKSPRYSILKALRLIEPLSIQVATQAELQKKLRESGKPVSHIRRATDNLNQILKYLDRGILLQKPKVGLRKVDYVTLPEFEQMFAEIPPGEVKDLAVVLFASGMRLGEALAVTKQDYKNGIVLIMKQLDKKALEKLPKAGKTGHSLVLEMGHEAIERWVSVENKERFRLPVYDALTRASKKVLGRSISPHDLRHSHAIHLLGLGADLTQVSLQLRNRIDVCQQYYSGFAHSEATLANLKNLVDATR